jgi:hypothetical protein
LKPASLSWADTFEPASTVSIMRSRSTASGLMRWATFSPSAPVEASPTTKPALSSTMRVAARMSGSSSMIRIVFPSSPVAMFVPLSSLGSIA